MKPTQSHQGTTGTPATSTLLAVWLVLAAGAYAQQSQQAPTPLQPGAENIQGILVVARPEDVNTAGVGGIRGVQVRGPDFLMRKDFQKLLEQNLGAPLTEASLSSMQTNIIRYCRERGHLVVDVFYREQDIIEGTIQVAVIEAKLGKVTVSNEGKKYFSDELVMREVGLEPGEPVIASRLEQGLSWVGRNTYQSLGYFDGTFHDVTASFRQGGLGETDVRLDVRDRSPVRVFGGIENTGIETIGENRLFGGFNAANLFRADHRLTYQYVTDTEFEGLRQHVGSYVAPLPWKHEFAAFGAYAETTPDLGVLGPGLAGFENDGTYVQASARYTVPLGKIKQLDHELSLAFDYKRTDSPLFFQQPGEPADLAYTNKIAVLQFAAAYTARLKDKWGGTAFALQAVYSPGGLTKYNEEGPYNEFSPGSDPNYFYGRGELRRETLLPGGFSWFIRASGQVSNAKLVATEQLSIGGYDTVRGYEERIVSGDHGWGLVNELRTRQFPLGNLLGTKGGRDWVQFLAFIDYGGVINRNRQFDQKYGEVLLGLGAGLRYQMAENFRARFDYGWQIDRTYADAAPNPDEVPESRAHFGLELSF